MEIINEEVFSDPVSGPDPPCAPPLLQRGFFLVGGGVKLELDRRAEGRAAEEPRAFGGRE